MKLFQSFPLSRFTFHWVWKKRFTPHYLISFKLKVKSGQWEVDDTRKSHFHPFHLIQSHCAVFSLGKMQWWSKKKPIFYPWPVETDHTVWQESASLSHLYSAACLTTFSFTPCSLRTYGQPARLNALLRAQSLEDRLLFKAQMDRDRSLSYFLPSLSVSQSLSHFLFINLLSLLPPFLPSPLPVDHFRPV